MTDIKCLIDSNNLNEWRYLHFNYSIFTSFLLCFLRIYYDVIRLFTN